MVAKEYALALFELASENVANMQEEYHLFMDVYESDFALLMESPKISKDQKKEMLKKITKDFSKTFQGFLFVLLDNNRFNEIKEINKAFDDMVYEKNGIALVQTIVVFPLEKEKMKDLQAFLEEMLQKKVFIEEKIDASLVGGIKIMYNGKCLDDTYKNKMAKLHAWI